MSLVTLLHVKGGRRGGRSDDTHNSADSLVDDNRGAKKTFEKTSIILGNIDLKLPKRIEKQYLKNDL